jgi:hypothetical protein
MPRMAAATTAARAPSTRMASTAPTAPTAACANRCHRRQPAYPPCLPARPSAWRRAPTPIATTAAPALSSRCAHTAPTVWAVDRANSCHHHLQGNRLGHHRLQGHRLGHHCLQGHRLRPHRLPACAPLRALECTRTAPIATTAAPATTVAPAPSSPSASMAPTARTAAREQQPPPLLLHDISSCAQAAPASSCATSASAFAPPSRKPRMCSAMAAVCLGVRWSGSTLATYC